MPTARELLEQADALMRRNRARAASLTAEPEIPVLTQPVGRDVVPAPATSATKPVKSESVRASAAAIVADVARTAPVAPRVDDDIPLLTDVVEEIEAPSIVPNAAEGEPSDWLELERHQGAPSITGPAPDSIAVVPPATLRPIAAGIPAAAMSPEPALDPARAPVAGHVPASETLPAGPIPADVSGTGDGEPERFALPDSWPGEIPTPAAGAPVASIQSPPPEALRAGHEGVAAPAAVSGPAWDALAEEIRMQVLQRIDIFTDTGLREKLGERLKPIVDRASADLVATINQHVGDLLRAYVAEAIEREIERWRDNNR